MLEMAVHRCGVRAVCALLIVAAFAVAPGGRVGATAAQSAAELQIKAAFLFNFVKFVTWAAAERPLGICIAGNPALTAAAIEVVRGRVVNGRNVAAMALPASQALDNCDLLYLADLKPDDASAI